MSRYIGNMHIVGERDSYNYNTYTDVFGVQDTNITEDHIWPTSRKGSNFADNKQILTKPSNNAKSNNLRGYINDIRFSILNHTTDEIGNVIGTMYISYDDGTTWYEVINN